MDYQVVCFGETLWDFLPKGKMPGGAPMNVAMHLNNLGVNTVMISKIGNDESGAELIEEIRQRDLDTSFIQIDADHPTGKVVADTSKKEEVKYTIEQPSAWDFIESNAAVEHVVAQATMFVFGSLATRNAASRATLKHLLKLSKRNVFDVNLRPPFDDKVTIEALLHESDIVKLNYEEFEILCGWYGIEGEFDARIATFQKHYNLISVCITNGKDGALYYTEGKLYTQRGFKVVVADTIGSGDAFLAAFIKKSIETTLPAYRLKFATALGSMVAARKGANHKISEQEISNFIKES